MTSPADAPAATRVARDLPRPWQWVAFAAIALAAVAALAVEHAAGRFVPTYGWQPGERLALTRLVGWSFAAAAAAAWLRPHLAHRAIAAGLGVGAVVTFGPAACAAAALLAWAAAVTGSRLLRAFGVPEPDWPDAVCAGLVLIAAVVGAASSVRIHWPWTYGIALAGSAIAWRGEWRGIARSLALDLAPTDGARPAALAFAILGTVLGVHLVVAGRPDVGSDAMTMHLQLAARMAHDHRFAHDVTQSIWAVMPLGIDWLYAAGFQLAGEPGAKAVNLGLFALLVAFVVRVGRDDGRRGRPLPLLLAALFASMPLAYAETGSLFVENGWAAMLVGAAWCAERAIRTRSPGLALAALWIAAGAMQAKVIGAPWVIVVAAALAWSFRDRIRAPRAGVVLALGSIAAVAAWPYAEALLRTGNPVFPFMNATFRSPLFEADASFNNANYNIPLSWRTWYDAIVHSTRFLEGQNGALGLHWLVLFPASFALLRAADTRRVLPLAVLAVLAFVAVWPQQSYLRYVYPSLALLIALAGRIEALDRAPAVAAGLALPFVAINLLLMPAGIWWNGTLCLKCAVDPAARAAFRDRYADQRRAVDWLLANAPRARVGWLRLHFPGPAGFTGPIWMASWHDFPSWSRLRTMTTAEEIAAFARERGADYFVLPRDDGGSAFEHAVAAFRDRYTSPVLTSGGTVLARWADVPADAIVRLPEDLARTNRDENVRAEGPRVVFPPRSLAWVEAATQARVVRYALTPACAERDGRGAVEAAWLDEGGNGIASQTNVHGCADDGRSAVGTFQAPPRAARVRIVVGSADGRSFALASFAAWGR